MRVRSPFREPVRVLMHLNGGYTRVSVVRTEGLGMADGGITWDIPTEAIPPHLRAIGAQFLAIVPRFTPEDHDSPDDIRRMIGQMEIHELTGDDRFTDRGRSEPQRPKGAPSTGRGVRACRAVLASG